MRLKRDNLGSSNLSLKGDTRRFTSFLHYVIFTRDEICPQISRQIKARHKYFSGSDCHSRYLPMSDLNHSCLVCSVAFNDSFFDDQTAAKKRLLRQHVKNLPRHVFDGSMIFSTQRLFPVSCIDSIFVLSDYHLISLINPINIAIFVLLDS